jgi:Ala-tRNA(Pro) deacylase
MELLHREAVGYELIHHEPDYTALEAANDTHTPGREFAKCVVIEAPVGPVLAVLPASRSVDLARFADLVGGSEVHLTEEGRIEALFPDCQVGAEPPFGRLYEMPVYVDEELARQEYITFNAGTHDESLRISFRDYERLERPTYAEFSVPYAAKGSPVGSRA